MVLFILLNNKIGAFGKVYQGDYDNKDCAIKTLSNITNQHQLNDLFTEITVMR